MSKHLNENNRKNPDKKQKSILTRLQIYPDFGMDSEGYPSGWKMPALMIGSSLVFLACLIFHPERRIALAVDALCVIAAGFFCFSNLAYNIRRGRFICEALPVLLACLLGFPAGASKASFLIMLFYQAVKLVETVTVRRQHEKAQALLRMLPASATVLDVRRKVKRTIKPVHIRAGNLLLVEAGETVPVDGVVVHGMSSVDLEPLISEKKILPVAPGSEIIGGCVNLSVPLRIRASCDYQESTAQKIYSSFTSVIRGENEDYTLAVKTGNLVFPAMLALSVLFGLLVPLFTGNWAAGLRRAMIFLLVSCPFALTGALTLGLFSAAAEIFSHGVVIRDVRILSKLSKLETFICNKTCTVTESAYTVREVCPEGISEERFLALLAKVESRSDHPIARAIRQYAGMTEADQTEELTVEEVPCRGIAAEISGHHILAGNAALLFENAINCAVPEGQGVAIHLGVDGKYYGYILLENPVREGNFEAIEQMHACGVRSFALLSGDLRSVVRPIALSLNFNVVKAELTKEGKISTADYLSGNRTPGKTIAYAGNGTDELEASSHTDLSVTTGALGKEEVSRADVVLLGEGITAFPVAVRASRAVQRLSFFSVAVQYGVRLVWIVLALVGIGAPALAGGVFAAIGIAAYLFASAFFARL